MRASRGAFLESGDCDPVHDALRAATTLGDRANRALLDCPDAPPEPVRRTESNVSPNQSHPPPLRLDTALQMLRQAGMSVPETGVGDDAGWLQAVIDGLCELSSRDALTGLANRRAFELALAREVDRVARTGEPALVLMIDIDHFKAVNDTHGHAAGDEVLKVVAQALADGIRPMDTLARVGGEEFAMILPNCPPAFGFGVAERLRHKVRARRAGIGPDREIGVTVSIGGAFAPQWVRSSPTLWVERADRQLYRAKSEGRDRACLEQPAISHVSAEEKGLLFGTALAQEDE
jgi:diguanylate cyclase (GGDEF)-like protein